MHLRTCETEMSTPMLRSDSAHAYSALVSGCARSRPLRIGFYSHDTMGMGHIRRNLLIASAVVKNSTNVEALLVAGTREAAYFATQAGLDCVTLPALTKSADGRYTARNLGWSLEDTASLRSQIIKATIEAYAPDVFVVDKLPKGIGNELLPTLELLSKTNAKCVLGLRDVLDEPTTVNREWLRDANDAAIEAYFDELWIYGDQSIYDCLKEYDFSTTVSSRAIFTGYLDQSDRNEINAESLPLVGREGQPMALCVVGGGQDGFALAETFVKSSMPIGWRGVIITGPFMPKDQQQKLHRFAQENRNVEIIDRLVETDEYLRQAQRVVAMGGYNTVTSILSFGKASMIVPRIVPRQEQWIRAKRLADLGWITAVRPEELNHEQITQWLSAEDVPVPDSSCVDLLGLNRISQRVGQWADKLASVCV